MSEVFIALFWGAGVVAVSLILLCVVGLIGSLMLRATVKLTKYLERVLGL